MGAWTLAGGLKAQTIAYKYTGAYAYFDLAGKTRVTLPKASWAGPLSPADPGWIQGWMSGWVFDVNVEVKQYPSSLSGAMSGGKFNLSSNPTLSAVASGTVKAGTNTTNYWEANAVLGMNSAVTDDGCKDVRSGFVNWKAPGNTFQVSNSPCVFDKDRWNISSAPQTIVLGMELRIVYRDDSNRTSSRTPFAWMTINLLYERDSPTITVTGIQPSVAVSDPAADYAKKGSGKPLAAKITGSNFPSSPEISFGDGIHAPDDLKVEVVSAKPTEIEVKLSGFENLPEGLRDVKVTSGSAPFKAGVGLFYVSSIRLPKGFEVNQGVPVTCTKARPCVASHPTAIRARLTCEGTRIDGSPCSSSNKAGKPTPGTVLPPPVSTGLLRV
jgi:hypothetical protein